MTAVFNGWILFQIIVFPWGPLLGAALWGLIAFGSRRWISNRPIGRVFWHAAIGVLALGILGPLLAILLAPFIGVSFERF